MYDIHLTFAGLNGLRDWIDWWIGLIGWLIDWLNRPAINQLFNQLIDQRTNQATNKQTSGPMHQSVSSIDPSIWSDKTYLILSLQQMNWWQQMCKHPYPTWSIWRFIVSECEDTRALTDIPSWTSDLAGWWSNSCTRNSTFKYSSYPLRRIMVLQLFCNSMKYLIKIVKEFVINLMYIFFRKLHVRENCKTTLEAQRPSH